MEPKIGVTIVTFNSVNVVGALLDSLLGALSGLDARVVVVDNGSTDQTVMMLRERSDCEVIECDNRGYAAGINAGAERLRDCTALLVLNPDVRLAPGSVRAMNNALSVVTGIVAPRVLNDDGSLQLSLRRDPSLLRAVGLGFTGRPAFSEHVSDVSVYRSEVFVDWALGAVLLVSRECHDALGGWDESFFLFSEETDFCLRARHNGWLTKYEPRALATHVGGQSGQGGRIHSMQIVNKVRFFARGNNALKSALYFWLTVVSEVSWLLRGQQMSRQSLRALMSPRSRPQELACSERLIPR